MGEITDEVDVPVEEEVVLGVLLPAASEAEFVSVLTLGLRSRDFLAEVTIVEPSIELLLKSDSPCLTLSLFSFLNRPVHVPVERLV